VFDGYGSRESFVAAAIADDGETLIAYIPNGNTIGVDLKVMRGNKVVAWWFNPRNGLSQRINTFTELQKVQFTPPDSKDWVLVVDDASSRFDPPGK
jgi:hypothetical protein